MLDPAQSPDFRVRAQSALANKNQSAAVARATTTISDRRDAALDEVPNWQEWRERARLIKAHVLENLDTYLEQFESNAKRRGATVHWARNAQEAIDLIFDIGKRAGSGAIVKA